MSESVDFIVDGRALRATAGSTVASAMFDAGLMVFRRSVTGQPRAPLCGMGICHECRVTIDGVPHRRACLVIAAKGMVVATSEGAS